MVAVVSGAAWWVTRRHGVSEDMPAQQIFSYFIHTGGGLGEVLSLGSRTVPSLVLSIELSCARDARVHLIAEYARACAPARAGEHRVNVPPYAV